MARCQIAGEEETPNTSRLYLNRPLCVFMTNNSFDASSSSLCEVNFRELPSSRQISKNILNFGQGISVNAHYSIDSQAIIPTYTNASVFLNRRYDRCGPVTKFNGFNYTVALKAVKLFFDVWTQRIRHGTSFHKFRL